MLVFISDLHITDRTTGVQHLDVSAFEEAFHNIARQTRAKDDKSPSQEITFVFLGDVFDLLRTTFWLDGKARPWDYMQGQSPPPASEAAQNAAALLRKIIEHPQNQPIFNFWQQSLKKKYGFEVEPKRVYVPGNHDRICNQFPALRQQVIQSLNLTDDRGAAWQPATPFAYHYAHADYGVFARHGQEWDHYNFEYVAKWETITARSRPRYVLPPLEHYLAIPIGELIAAEVASRLPTAVCQQLKRRGIDPDDLKAITEHMKTIDDVRPTAAILPWLINSIHVQPAMWRNRPLVLEALTEAIQAVITHFEALPFTEQWMRQHDSFAPWDYVDQLQLALLALKSWMSGA